MFKKWILASMIVLVLAGAVFGKTQVIKLKDGRSFTGEVTKTEGGYRIKTKHAVLTFSADQVAKIEDATTSATEYEDLVKKIDPKKPEDHFGLANWAIKRGLAKATDQQLKIARKHLEIALKLKPDYERAKLLLQLVNARIDKPPKQDGSKIDLITDVDFPLLKDDDIRKIRVEELRKGDSVAIKFKNDVVKRFMASMEGQEDFRKPRFEKKFLGWPKTRKVVYMLDKRPDNVKMKDDIFIESDPKFMKNFRQLWPVINNFCAASSCHGGIKPKGGLILFTRGSGNERADYTNFAILDGVVAGGRRVIDRDNPAESLLLHYLLPRKVANNKHPIETADSAKVHTAFKNRRVNNYKRILRWIDELAGPPHPGYRLNYKPPFGITLRTGLILDLSMPTTQPATMPAEEDDFFK